MIKKKTKKNNRLKVDSLKGHTFIIYILIGSWFYTRSVTLIIRFVFTVLSGRRSKQALLGFIRKLLVSHSALSREPTNKKRLGKMAADGRKTFKSIRLRNKKCQSNGTFRRRFFIYILSFSGPLVTLSKILLQDLFFYRVGTFHNLFFYLCNIYVRVISVHTWPVKQILTINAK